MFRGLKKIFSNIFQPCDSNSTNKPSENRPSVTIGSSSLEKDGQIKRDSLLSKSSSRLQKPELSKKSNKNKTPFKKSSKYGKEKSFNSDQQDIVISKEDVMLLREAFDKLNKLSPNMFSEKIGNVDKPNFSSKLETSSDLKKNLVTGGKNKFENINKIPGPRELNKKNNLDALRGPLMKEKFGGPGISNKLNKTDGRDNLKDIGSKDKKIATMKEKMMKEKEITSPGNVQDKINKIQALKGAELKDDKPPSMKGKDVISPGNVQDKINKIQALKGAELKDKKIAAMKEKMRKEKNTTSLDNVKDKVTKVTKSKESESIESGDKNETSVSTENDSKESSISTTSIKDVSAFKEVDKQQSSSEIKIDSAADQSSEGKPKLVISSSDKSNTLSSKARRKQAKKMPIRNLASSESGSSSKAKTEKGTESLSTKDDLLKESSSESNIQKETETGVVSDSSIMKSTSKSISENKLDKKPTDIDRDKIVRSKKEDLFKKKSTDLDTKSSVSTDQKQEVVKNERKRKSIKNSETKKSLKKEKNEDKKIENIGDNVTFNLKEKMETDDLGNSERKKIKEKKSKIDSKKSNKDNKREEVVTPKKTVDQIKSNKDNLKQIEAVQDTSSDMMTDKIDKTDPVQKKNNLHEIYKNHKSDTKKENISLSEVDQGRKDKGKRKQESNLQLSSKPIVNNEPNNTKSKIIEKVEDKINVESKSTQMNKTVSSQTPVEIDIKMKDNEKVNTFPMSVDKQNFSDATNDIKIYDELIENEKDLKDLDSYSKYCISIFDYCCECRCKKIKMPIPMCPSITCKQNLEKLCTPLKKSRSMVVLSRPKVRCDCENFSRCSSTGSETLNISCNLLLGDVIYDNCCPQRVICISR